MRVHGVVLVSVLVAGCSTPPPEPTKLHPMKEYWEKDIQLCRDRGGVPITDLVYGGWSNESAIKLMRCDLPPAPGHLEKP